MRIGIGIGVPTFGGSFYTGILDAYGNAAAAWSVTRKLRAGYNGYAINVRRSSDNTTQDIGFTGDGNLDTSTLLSFCAATDGLVTKIYDQSGNGLDRVQATAASQAKIVSSGSLLTLNGKPAIDFSAGSRYYTAGTTSSWKFLHDGTKSFISLVQNYANATNYIINTGGNSTSQVGILIQSQTTNAIRMTVQYGSAGSSVFSTSSNNYFASAGTQYITGIVLDLSNATPASRGMCYVNGGNNAWNNSASNTPSSANSAQALGAPDGSNYYTGMMQEMIFWNIDQTSNRTGIRDNQRTFYGSY